MKINIDPAQITQNVKQRNGKKLGQFAQIVLDDSNEFIPRDQDDLLKSGAINVESDEKATVGWYNPYAHYQYKGELMVGRESRSAWAKSGETKVYAGKPLQYSKDKNPQAQKEWFEAAKKKHKGWEKQANKLFGGG